MKAVVFYQSGEPSEALKVVDVPRAQLTEGKALIEVTARPIHPADIAFIRGHYRIHPQFPQVAGLEGTGTVIGAPPGTHFKMGTRVAFRWPGSWAEQVAVPEERLIEVPADVPDTSACQFSLNPVTAWGLLDAAGVVAGDWVLLTAATSTVSNLIGAIARHRGIGVIGLVRGDAGLAGVRCTVNHVISSDDPDCVGKIVAATGSHRITALLDSVGGPRVTDLFATLAPGARIIAYGVQDHEPAAITNAMLIYSNLVWRGFGIDHWLSKLSRQDTVAMHETLWSMLRSGALKLPVASIHGLDAIVEALAANDQVNRKGKVLLSGNHSY